MDFFIHHTAIADDGCTIGKGSKIWHFCHIMTGAVIGSDCILGQNVFVAATVVLGNHVKVQNNVSLYDGVICGDDVFIGPSAVFTNVINPRSHIIRKNEYSRTLVHNGATIGANATIVCGIESGMYAFVGAGAVVTKNVPPYALVTGNPAKQKGWISEAGVKLQFGTDGKAACTATGDNYILGENGVRKIITQY
jgi:UDP-2-acetamido-3-amino-2,3-dideoxy-glucuronate N-acetyltransferase